MGNLNPNYMLGIYIDLDFTINIIVLYGPLKSLGITVYLKMWRLWACK